MVVYGPLEQYCGLSGILNAVWVCGALAAARIELARGDRLMAGLYALCIALDLAKIGSEAVTGQTVFADTVALGGPPAPMAHVLGALAGCAAFFVLRIRSVTVDVGSRARERFSY
ncbi:MAG: hypothetical protein JSV80_12075 [Acidobacteriota bacterium]|nr:MAG: hypothetical protein JSV80_12075 [Acidobacteriota bacterium]